MTKEEKELLVKDLCARLPYGVMCKIFENLYELVDIDIKRGLVYLLRDEQYVPYSIISGDEIKPYLRPMSSMTEDEKKELCDKNILIAVSTSGTVETIINGFDWMNAHHFDYRGLIPMGLAIEAPEYMYKEIICVKQSPLETFKRVNEFEGGASYRN